jgi:hypothetical protein
MKRRRVLAGSVTLLAALLAGCPGSEETGESTATPTATATADTGTASRADGPPTPTPTPTPTPPTETPTPSPTPTATPSVQRRQVALGAYRAGFEQRKEYGEATRVARDGFTNRTYEGGELKYSQAVESAEAAITHFERAGEIATETGTSQARELADEALGRVRQYLLPFAELGVEAARAAQDGRFEDAGDLVGEMETLSEELRVSPLRMVNPGIFENALGL